MAPLRCRRVCQQTWALTVKNALVFSKSPVVSLFRALILPVAITVVFCFLKYIKGPASEPYGISYAGAPVLDLPTAMSATPSHRLVFSLNGIESRALNDTIHAIGDESGMGPFDIQIIDEPTALYDACRQSIQGTSECFAAVIFTAFDDDNAEYIMALDDHAVRGPTSYKTRHSILTDRLLPLQWAIDSHLGNFTSVQRPTEKMWHGHFGQSSIYLDGPYDEEQSALRNESSYWLGLVRTFVAPIFTLILIPLGYHVSTAVANERQTGLAELMMAQGVTVTPRVLSNFLSFFALYLPGVIVSSILLGEVLFVATSTGLVFILVLLASLAVLAWSHVIGSLFSRAQLAGLCGSLLTFVVGLLMIPVVMLTRTLAPTYVLSVLFPPYAWATLIRDIAGAEAMGRAFPDPQAASYNGNVQGDLYFLFFIVQIVLYIAGVYAIECWRWTLPKKRDWIDGADDVALRLSHLSKTFSSKNAVDDLSLDVQKGSVTFLLGPNGSGKTTVLNCISRMMRVDEGSSIQFNRDYYSFGLCPQSNILWDSLTVKEHLRIWCKLKSAGRSITEEQDDVLTECDLTEKTNAASETLSGGQKRKLQLAIAFAGGSKVCCIDEATSGLDPLSRRNIWNIIQQGRRQRTTILTTHFLDEADVLADHLVIMCKGRLVCQGTSVALKTQYGDGYKVSVGPDQLDDCATTFKAASSAEATNKVLELERLGGDTTCSIAFPTLEQVFLKATSGLNTAVQQTGGDGIVGDLEPEPEASDVFEDKIAALENEYQGDLDLDLDVGRSIGILRQIAVLFMKRYMLLLQPSSFIAYLINLAIPIIVAGALSKYLYTWQPLTTCEAQYNSFINSSASDISPLDSAWYPAKPDPGSVIGPKEKMTGPVQEALYADSLTGIYKLVLGTPTPESAANMALETRQFVDSQHEFKNAINESSGLAGFGLYAETPDTAIFFHDTTADGTGFGLGGFSFLTNRIANSTSTTKARQVSTSMRVMRHVQPSHNFFALPMSVLVVIAFIAAVSTAAIYPIYERISKVRSLQYSNGVSPFALWTAYLLFDMQFIFIETFIAWGVLMVRPIEHVWYRPDCIFGALILFGIASYLGTYLLSNVIRKAGYAAALGLHLLFFVLYFIAYVANQFGGSAYSRHETYEALQNGLGLIAPGANLARALFLGMNTFDVLCGKHGGADTSYPFAYSRYGGVYANLVYQILFLIVALGLCEYGSREWFRRLLWWRRRVPARLHHTVDAGDEPGPRSLDGDIQLGPPKSFADAAGADPDPTILQVDRVSKYFGSSFAAQNVSLHIPANETLALLGANGAGKTTVINMIRGELKPEFGDVHVDGVSVVRQPRKARLQIGVCPQDDAVDNLTVWQTLHFYASVKGLKSVRKNVQQVLNALDIGQFANVRARKLSGGTRRKLTVAIALLGNPRLLLLDEPSTNQDAGAKRILWRALERIRANRAILLTTHSMEEAEALASRVAIMRTRLLVSGPLASLNISYGGSYRLRAVRPAAGVSVDYARETVQNALADDSCHVWNYADMNGLVQFFVNYDRALLPRILLVMERLKIGSPFAAEHSGLQSASSAGAWDQARVFEDYTLIEPTLEEVFMNVSREAEGL